MKKSLPKVMLTTYFRSSVIVLSSMIFCIGLQAQDCTSSMACNDGVQVSLNETCDVEITPSIMLEGAEFPDAFYEVTVSDENGVPFPSPILDESHIGRILTVSVNQTGCSISCWGYITIEDKLPPLVTNCLDITIDCTDSREPGVVIPEPTFDDPCSGIAEGTYVDEFENLPCTSPFTQIITRRWTASDDRGNIATCVQIISVLRADIALTVFPMNYDGIELPAFECTDDIDFLENWTPSPEQTGYPSGVECPNIQYHFEDIIFPICGASKKILRQWTVLDWCTGQDTMDSQIIKILDTQAPVCTDNGDTTYVAYTDDGICTGSFQVPHPTIIEECSDYTYIVGYKPKDDSNDPFTDVIYNKTSIDEDGNKTLHLIPLDTSWLVYTITDACGNSSQCYNLIVVKDNQSPTAICEGFTVITLDNNGTADLYAFSLDDGSWDNCEIDSFKVKRDIDNCGRPGDLEFSDKIYFCCEDTEVDYIMVTLRVIDKWGNYNDCRVQVRVQDKIDPMITCPVDVTIVCTDDKDDLELTGMATATDPCLDTIFYEDDLRDLNDCGVGLIQRIWTARDKGGRTDICIQDIYVTTENPFTENSIYWPKDAVIDGCKSLDADPEGEAGKPTVGEDVCLNFAYSFSDQNFYNVEGYCVKILRTWKVTDWCSFEPDQPFFYYHIQKIVLNNTTPPAFVSGCSNKEVTTESCESYIDLEVYASDDCTEDTKINYRWKIDEDNDGDKDYEGTGRDASGIYSSGTHEITYYATDECGNESSCTFLFTIRDTKAPTPICYGELVWVLDHEGNATVWANDFNLKSTDGCTETDSLYFSFTDDGNSPSKDFDCSYVENGVAAEVPLTMYVFDESGNYSYCDVILILQDSPNGDACLDNEGVSGRIAGRILNETNEGLENVEVELENMTMEDNLMKKTDGQGEFGFSEVEYYDAYHLFPYKNDDAINGVSTLDLVFIQQHILGLRMLDTPYKLIAADVNGNNNISASDLIELRKIILGINHEFTNNTSWRFIPSEYAFEDGENPWTFPQDIMIEEFYLDNEEVDFIALKTGDINGTATANARDRDLSTRNRNSLQLTSQSQVKNEKTYVSISSENAIDLLGMQFTFELSQDMNVISIIPGILNVDENNFGFNKKSDGLVTFSWSEANGVEVGSDILFTVVLDGKIDADKLGIGSEVTAAEAYNSAGQIFELQLDNRLTEKEVSGDFVLYQNNPNPFNEVSEVSFFLPEDGTVHLSVYDVSGKEIMHKTATLPQGLNAFQLKKSEINTTGVLYYQVRAGNYSDTRKMIILD